MKRLSRYDIELIARRIVKAYWNLPEVQNDDFLRVNPELMATQVLDLNIDYEHLSLDGNTLGLTAFGEVGVEVYDITGEPYWYVLDGKTILVESDLKNDITKVGRCNFSIMHECAHQALKMLYPHEYGVAADSTPALHFYKVGGYQRPIRDWEEWQANALASAIFLPAESIKQGMSMFGLGNRIEILNRLYRRSEYKQFCCLAEYLGASKKALAIRMKYLGLLKDDYLDNPYSLADVTCD